MNNKALIAMSGGVDSSVAAWLLLTQNFECLGATMRMFPGSDADTADAREVAGKLGLEYRVFDAAGPFRDHVLEPFVHCYEVGLTPNPCIRCNHHLKFGFFLEKALEVGCDWMATGHYARITQDPETGRYLLRKAADESKDQTYFLACLTQGQLAHIRFPLGDLTKDQVRQIAQDQGFLNARKRDSQDICFVPDGDYMRFLEDFTGKVYEPGAYLDLDGNRVGTHRGAVAYTLGQRKGLNLAMGVPVYVCAKDMAANTVTVGPNEALYHRTLIANDWTWFPFPALAGPLRCKAKARSRMAEQPATVYPMEDGFARVIFDEPQRAMTPGQAVVLYDGDTVIGGGTITQISD